MENLQELDRNHHKMADFIIKNSKVRTFAFDISEQTRKLMNTWFAKNRRQA